ncbi:MAG: 3-dehydroquinate synthase [Cyanobacteriota bacterium]
MEDIKLNIDIPSQINISYPIFIGERIFKKTGEIIKQYIPSSKLLLVSNDTVFPIYGNQVIEILKQEGFNVKSVVIPDGEDYKNINWLKVIIDKAIDFNLERKDSIVALGGGVIGDMAGFAAASYLRGINLVQIATTLLAQVDSSIGGKVGINHAKGKNLIGAFYQPKCVIIDVLTLNTLDKRNLKNGLAEVLKYAFIEESCNCNNKKLNFFNFLNENKNQIYKLDVETIATMIEHCCILKAAVVEQDEKESGLRAILNLGHTTGHALEVCGNYQILSHGEGVSIGMIAALRIASEMELISKNLACESERFIKNFELLTSIPENINVKDIIEAMKKDKKIIKGKLRFILPTKNIGNVEIYDNVDEKLLINVLNSLY